MKLDAKILKGSAAVERLIAAVESIKPMIGRLGSKLDSPLCCEYCDATDEANNEEHVEHANSCRARELLSAFDALKAMEGK